MKCRQVKEKQVGLVAMERGGQAFGRAVQCGVYPEAGPGESGPGESGQGPTPWVPGPTLQSFCREQLQSQRGPL